MDVFVHIWPALQGQGRSSTNFTGQCAVYDSAVLKKKKKLKFVDGKSSVREKESIISMKILIYSVTKRLSDKLNIISDVTPVLVCLDGIQLN